VGTYGYVDGVLPTHIQCVVRMSERGLVMIRHVVADVGQ
jgi:hypothetical protein